MADKHAFRRAVEARDFGNIGELFSEHAILNSPIAFRPYRGREAVAKIVTTVAAIFDGFTFQRETAAQTGDYHALMFGARVDGLSTQGCDFLHTDSDGLIDEITVMLRPLKGVHAFEKRMKAMFTPVSTGEGEIETATSAISNSTSSSSCEFGGSSVPGRS